MNIIACSSLDWGIGYMGKLLFDIPVDKAFFKEKTIGKTVIMGRKTYESLPVKPLPSRRNIVLTRKNMVYEGVEICHNINDVLNIIENEKKSDIFVIGGEQIYSLLLPFCNTAYITCVKQSVKSDRHIFDFDSSDEWKCTECSADQIYSGLIFCFKKYIRII